MKPARSPASSAVEAHVDGRGPLRVSAKVDYAVRAVVELAAHGNGEFVKGIAIAERQRIPLKFLLNILGELRDAKIVRTHRGSGGGFALARPADRISVAAVVRAAAMSEPQQPAGEAGAEPVRALWFSVQEAIDDVLERVTIAQLTEPSASGHSSR